MMKPNYSGNDGSNAPNPFFVNCALIAPQLIFGISAVVGTIGLPSFHPLTFAIVREANATIILLLAAHAVSKYAGRESGLWSGSLKDWKLILLSALGLFMSQAFYIMGIKLSSAVAASVWQPSQPILTAAVCMVLGWEPFNFHRLLGIFVAFLGCAIMVLGGGTVTGESMGGGGEEYNSAFSNMMGQVSFLINSCGSSLYVLASKRVLATGRYESVAVTAWSYLCATFMMIVFGLVMSTSESLSMFLCSDCEGSVWHVPRSAIPALIWYIVMASSTAYGLITWGNKYATGTLVIGYTVIQPMASAVMIQFLISFGLYESCSVVGGGGRSLMALGGRTLSEMIKPCLDEPDRYTAFGAIGVVAGLMVVINTEPKKDAGMVPDDLTDDDDEIENEALLELGILDKSLLLEDDDEDLIMETQE